MEKSTRYLALHPVSFASLILVEEEMRRDERKNELKKKTQAVRDDLIGLCLS